MIDQSGRARIESHLEADRTWRASTRDRGSETQRTCGQGTGGDRDQSATEGTGGRSGSPVGRSGTGGGDRKDWKPSRPRRSGHRRWRSRLEAQSARGQGTGGGDRGMEAQSTRGQGSGSGDRGWKPSRPAGQGTGGGDRWLEAQSARRPRHRRWRSRLETQSAPQGKAPVAVIEAGNPVGPAGPGGGERERGWKPSRPTGPGRLAVRSRMEAKPAGGQGRGRKRGGGRAQATGGRQVAGARPWRRRGGGRKGGGRIVAMIAHVVLFKPKPSLTDAQNGRLSSPI